MLERKLKMRLKVLILIIMLLLITLIILCESAFQKKINNKQARIEVNQLVRVLEQKKTIENFPYEYVVLDKDGTVETTTNPNYRTGDKVNLRTISDVSVAEIEGKYYRYKTLLLVDGEINKVLLVNVDKSNLLLSNWIRIVFYTVLGLIIITVILLERRIRRTLKEDVFRPAQEMHEVTKRMMKGDYSEKIKYDYDSEIGTLCHDFESVRDELKDSFQREEKLKESEKIMLACISHDLKTPLSSISGYVEAIGEGVVTKQEEIKNYTDIILRKVMTVNKLIDDILEHSKAELEELSIEKTEVYSEPFFKNCFEEFRNDVTSMGNEYEVVAIPNVLICIDQRRIEQVIGNIIMNSIKYMGDNGKLTVTVSVEASVQQEGTLHREDLVIEIKDTGRGIPAADIPFVFDKFFRGEKARNQNIPGSGLGLSIAKYIVEKHGGGIECDSIMKKGTKITFWLPI